MSIFEPILYIPVPTAPRKKKPAPQSMQQHVNYSDIIQPLERSLSDKRSMHKPTIDGSYEVPEISNIDLICDNNTERQQYTVDTSQTTTSKKNTELMDPNLGDTIETDISAKEINSRSSSQNSSALRTNSNPHIPYYMEDFSLGASHASPAEWITNNRNAGSPFGCDVGLFSVSNGENESIVTAASNAPLEYSTESSHCQPDCHYDQGTVQQANEGSVYGEQQQEVYMRAESEAGDGHCTHQEQEMWHSAKLCHDSENDETDSDSQRGVSSLSTGLVRPSDDCECIPPFVDRRHHHCRTLESESVGEYQEWPFQGFLKRSKIGDDITYNLQFQLQHIPEHLHLHVLSKTLNIDSADNSTSIHHDNTLQSKKTPQMRRKRVSWRPEENKTIQAMKKDGCTWLEIHQALPHRTQGAIQVQYSTKLKKKRSLSSSRSRFPAKKIPGIEVRIPYAYSNVC